MKYKFKVFGQYIKKNLQKVLLINADFLFFLFLAQRSQSGCNSLITSNSNVKFTASSSSEGPGTPVINGNDVWCAGVVNADQYLKVDLGE